MEVRMRSREGVEWVGVRKKKVRDYKKGLGGERRGWGRGEALEKGRSGGMGCFDKV